MPVSKDVQFATCNKIGGHCVQVLAARRSHESEKFTSNVSTAHSTGQRIRGRYCGLPFSLVLVDNCLGLSHIAMGS